MNDMSDNTTIAVVMCAVAIMFSVGLVAYNWRVVEIAKITAEVDKVKAEEGKKFKFGTTKDE
jgi:hypothetical protein